jgi:hypothetical protein
MSSRKEETGKLIRDEAIERDQMLLVYMAGDKLRDNASGSSRKPVDVSPQTVYYLQAAIYVKYICGAMNFIGPRGNNVIHPNNQDRLCHCPSAWTKTCGNLQDGCA